MRVCVRVGTLLNLLFGTTFMMMDVRHRRQCTKGIYLSHGNTKDILIFDVEGTDGRERGEQQQDFERKTSLFSFALAQVVIVNMWAHDIGRYHGANLHLLRIVLELNLQLFQHGKFVSTTITSPTSIHPSIDLLAISLTHSRPLSLQQEDSPVVHDPRLRWPHTDR